MVRISDGFQPHLVSPEAGLRKLVQESIEMVLDPVSTAVRRVHQVLLECARWEWTAAPRSMQARGRGGGGGETEFKLDVREREGERNVGD